MEHHVGEQVYCSAEMFALYGAVIHCRLLVRVSIQFAPDAFERLYNLPCLASLCAFEGGMLAEVCQSSLAFLLVSRARLDSIAAVDHLALRWTLYDAKSVVKRVSVIHLFSACYSQWGDVFFSAKVHYYFQICKFCIVVCQFCCLVAV